MLKKLFGSVDLTKGVIWQVIVIFAIPILLSYLFQQIYTISDAAICGQFLNANQVAGVNNTSNITFIVLQFAFGCTAGFSVVSASKIGQNDIKGARQSLLVQMILSFIISVILTVIAILSIDLLLNFIGVEESKNKEIYDAAYIYTFIIFLGTIAQVFYNLACSFLSLAVLSSIICLAVFSSLTTYMASPALGISANPSSDMGDEGPASLILRPLSSLMALTLPDVSPDTT